MKSIVMNILRLILAMLFGYIVFVIVGITLDKMSDILRPYPEAKKDVEFMLAILSPTGYGILILVVLMAGFYIMLPKWFPRLFDHKLQDR